MAGPWLRWGRQAGTGSGHLGPGAFEKPEGCQCEMSRGLGWRQEVWEGPLQGFRGLREVTVGQGKPREKQIQGWRTPVGLRLATLRAALPSTSSSCEPFHVKLLLALTLEPEAPRLHQNPSPQALPSCSLRS